MDNLPTFDDLRLHFCTGRAYVISGTGRDRKYGYRHGVWCNLGDLEEADWVQQVKDLIRRSGEDELHEQLLQWCRENNFAKEKEKDLRFRAVEMHAARIFDDERWVDYLAFNRRFRPEVIDPSRLRWIRTACCNKPGQTTVKLVEEVSNGLTCCPICGRWALFEVLESEDADISGFAEQ